MLTAPQILENMHALAEFAAESPEAIAMAAGSVNPVEALRMSINSSEYNIGVEDGFANIVADNPSSDSTYTVRFDAPSNVLELRNLTTGESQGIDIGGTAIAAGQEQEIEYVGLGLTVTLNAAFSKTTDISAAGGAVSATGGGGGAFSGSSFKVTDADIGVARSLTGASGEIDGTTANAAVVTVGGFSGTADLSSNGEKSITMTDGTDTFELEFAVSTALSDTDDADIDINGLGAMFFIDAPSDVTITATDSGGLLRGSGGNDKLSGAGGDDTIQGLAGDDQIFGLAGNDDFDGGSGTDTLDLSDAASGIIARLDLGAVRNADGDKASLTSIENVIGSNFDDLIIGNGSANRLIGRSGDDQISGLDGDDQLFGNTGDDVLRGGDGDDILNGSAGQDSLRGEAGNDVLRGGNGNDSALGGAGRDHIEGGAGVDRMYGQTGDDTLLGGSGGDRVRGGDGDDVINGGDGNDPILGGADDDEITGGAGFDRIATGSGADVIFLTDGFDYDRVFDFEDGVERLDFSGVSAVSSTADLTIRTFNGGADTRIDVTASDFVVLVGVAAADVTTADLIF